MEQFNGIMVRVSSSLFSVITYKQGLHSQGEVFLTEMEISPVFPFFGKLNLVVKLFFSVRLLTISVEYETL